jgi:hypothetical protein
MKIALDYDGTVTEDPDLWYLFVQYAQLKGHEVKIVTFRSGDELTTDLLEFAERADVELILTARTLKKEFCRSLNWEPDVWIDDNPGLIGDKGIPWDDEQHAKWKETLSDRLVEEQGSPDDSELPTLNTV